ncbi:MAG: DUF748 domain-containing protein [Lysobacterales bacterium]|nr:MAG: DUF748 domain-containing protein [Xanthomonadales bacterium]
MSAGTLFRSKIFWLVAVPLLLVGGYALAGFKLAPKLVRDQAVAFVRENYGRELAIGSVSIHPFKLQLEVRDVALPDSDGATMVGFERLFADFEIASLWERAFVFRTIEVDGPLVRAVLRKDGSLNLGDLALPGDPDEPPSPPPNLWIHAFRVDRGTVDFVDATRARPFERQFAPVTFALEDFRTTPEGGDFRLSARSKADETFDWKGRFALAPVVSSKGDFVIGDLQATGVAEFLGDALPFQLSGGTIDLAGTYEATVGEPLAVEVKLPAINVAGLGLRARGVDADWVTLPTLALENTNVSVAARQLTIGRIALAGPRVEAWLEPDGSVNVERLFTHDAAGTAEPASTPPPAPEPAPAPTPAPVPEPAPASTRASGDDWSVTIAGIEVSDAAIAFEDRSTEPFKQFAFAPVDLKVAGASLDLAKPLPVTLDATINDHASFHAEGTVTPEPLAAALDIRLADARMQILQPYILPLADLSITAGELDVTGRAKLAPPGGKTPEMSFDGSVVVDGFASVDNALKQDLVNFRRIALDEVRFGLAPDSLSIDRITVTQPYARVIISEEQVLNIAAVLDPQGTEAALAERRAAAAAEAARSPAEKRRLAKEQQAREKAEAKARKSGTAPAPPPAAAPSPDTFPVRIREIRVADGRMNFSDYSVQPNFSAEIEQLAGSVTGLSSAWESRAKVDFKGSVGEFSPVTIAGQLQPFAFDRYTDIGMRFENIPLPIFNPYSGPLAGYNIAKGKLTTDLHYLIEARRLDAQHKIRIDQLEWGEASDTQGEATLPVKLATSLLKDRDGVITLDVPVGGTLDDPTFRIGPIVWQIVKNLIVKAVTAPFALLGSLFEGAEDAQFVEFAPGDATLAPATAEQLAALARSLVERPQLNLEVPIGAIAETDRPALVERAYAAALAAATTSVVGKGKPEAPPFGQLDAKQQIAVLKAVIEQQTGAEPELPEPPKPPEGTSKDEARALRDQAALAYLEQTARAGVTVPDTELERLAEERAAAVERALLANAELQPTRVFKVREGKVSTQDGQVRLELGLQ